jgi:hypothetical protein
VCGGVAPHRLRGLAVSNPPALMPGSAFDAGAMPTAVMSLLIMWLMIDRPGPALEFRREQ